MSFLDLDEVPVVGLCLRTTPVSACPADSASATLFPTVGLNLLCPGSISCFSLLMFRTCTLYLVADETSSLGGWLMRLVPLISLMWTDRPSLPRHQLDEGRKL